MSPSSRALARMPSEFLDVMLPHMLKSETTRTEPPAEMAGGSSVVASREERVASILQTADEISDVGLNTASVGHVRVRRTADAAALSGIQAGSEGPWVR